MLFNRLLREKDKVIIRQTTMQVQPLFYKKMYI